MIRIGSIVAFAIAVSGCAAQGPPFEPAQAPRSNAIIYVYRPYTYFGSLLEPPVTCGNESFAIKPGAYHAYVVPPGKVICKVETMTGADEVEIDAQPGRYYLREEIALGWKVGWPQLNPVDTDVEHEREIQTCCVQQR